MRVRSSSTSSSSSSSSTSSSSSSSSGSSHGRHHRHPKHHHSKEMKRFHKMKGHHFKNSMVCGRMGPFPPGPHYGPHAVRMRHHHHTLHPHFGVRNVFHPPPRTGDEVENMQSQMEILRINVNHPSRCYGKHMKHLHKRLRKIHRNYTPRFSQTEYHQNFSSFNKKIQKEDNYLVKLEKKAKKLQKKMDKLEEKRQCYLMLLGFQLDMQEDASNENREESSQQEDNVQSEQTPLREDTAAPVEAN